MSCSTTATPAESDMGTYCRKQAAQLGTVGSGNQYVDPLRDEDGFVWIGVHFGSCGGLGHTSATRYPGRRWRQGRHERTPAVIDEDSEIGGVLHRGDATRRALPYAGREWVIERAQDHRWQGD